jgi:hypothetical protein
MLQHRTAVDACGVMINSMHKALAVDAFAVRPEILCS